MNSFINERVPAELHIFGKGEYEQELNDISKVHSNIIYHGFVSRDEILKWQKNAKLLVNPRNNASQFNEYSFPSKNFEYMLSGVPYLGYKLSGMTDKYDPFFIRVSESETIGSKNQ